VGSYAPNKLGLYDMHGNVYQWCEDLYDQKASRRVVRGGGWYYTGDCRAAGRLGNGQAARFDSLGLRVARVPVRAKGK
jgi:formylglycine-generating enzyme required for sulfatase activity